MLRLTDFPLAKILALAFSFRKNLNAHLPRTRPHRLSSVNHVIKSQALNDTPFEPSAFAHHDCHILAAMSD